ncbi:acid protease [Lentinus tigrinus ALCF2SS1-6]|uniref:Acid protease n=1 Tax=Lentinus tigrinus ALCF2SS1-6 TaxID=1328759 RepID=A0A5C2SPT5_9APHY|nr:acid protease [Lentinus tigrinus ALCF2SS1-6]
MLLRRSLLHVAEVFLPLALVACRTAAVAAQGLGSRFDITAHRTGYQYAAAEQLNSENLQAVTKDDLLYTTDIMLGGQKFTVSLDTGSTDLWINTKGRNVQLTNQTGITTSITYGVGKVEGPIDFAQVKIGDVDSQAFINPTSIVDFNLAVDGIMGMAFDVGSIHTAFKNAFGAAAADTLGRAPITSLFGAHPSLPNNFDVQLARTGETQDLADGSFTISAHAPGFDAALAGAPKLPRVSDQHWSIVMDAMSVNGKAFAFEGSRIAGVPQGKTVAALDTGFSFPPLPPKAVDAIYSSIPGAVFNPSSKLWAVPCNATTNLSFTFGGKDFVVHPLDLTRTMVADITTNGQKKQVTICINTYQYLTLDPNSFQGFDMILGDAFLRNVYASFDYGDTQPGNTNSGPGIPFVQMVSTTDASKVMDEFTTERAETLSKLPPELSPSDFVRIASGGSGSVGAGTSGAAEESGQGRDEGSVLGLKYGMVAMILLGANLAVGIALIGLTVAICVQGRKNRLNMRTYVPVRFRDEFEQGSSKYGS